VQANSKVKSSASGNSESLSYPKSRILLFGLLAVIGGATDLITKELVFNWRGAPQAHVDNTWWLIDGYVGIQTSVNQGALFGMGQGYSTLFAILSVIAGAGIVFWLFFKSGARDRLLTIALGCISGGIIGNLYDRLGLWHGREAAAHFQHGVRDWILLRYKDHTWPNFNIADSLLVCGAALLFCHAIFYREPQKTETGKQSEDTSPAGS
jgi:signal peptidase II